MQSRWRDIAAWEFADDFDARDLDELRANKQEVTGEETKDRSMARIIKQIEEAQESIATIENGKEMRAEADADPATRETSRGKGKAAEETDGPDDGGEERLIRR